MTAKNKIEQVFPVGSLVRAFRNGEMWAGEVTSHREDDTLTVRFNDGTGQTERYAYFEINLDNPGESMVIAQRFESGRRVDEIEE